MRWLLAVAALACVAGAAVGQDAVEQASAALGVDRVETISYAGAGRWYQFGQAANPTRPWPQFDVERFVAEIDYGREAARVRMDRTQTVDSGRLRPVSIQRPDQFVAGAHAWANAVGGDGTTTAQPQPAAAAERAMEIWATPHGFLKAARANKATAEKKGAATEIVFVDRRKQRYVGAIGASGDIESVTTWLADPVLGDVPVVFAYAGYRNYGDVRFPARISRRQGNYPVLELEVREVKSGIAVAVAVPKEVAAYKPPPITVTSQLLAPGVFYLAGGTHHSVAIVQADHVVLVEAPQNEARSLALIAKIKEIAPGKPITHVINTHAHFDHAGGLRTFVDLGATIVTHKMNQLYYEKIWSAPHTIAPDRLSKSNKTAKIMPFIDELVLGGAHTIEVYPISGNGHNDGFAMVYLPAEKMLIEADAYTPGAHDAAPPATPNPYSVNLHDNILRRPLDVETIVPLHGRIVTLADLRRDIRYVPRKQVDRSNAPVSDTGDGPAGCKTELIYC